MLLKFKLKKKIFFTMLCWFPPYNSANQSRLYLHLLPPPRRSSPAVITEPDWAPCPVRQLLSSYISHVTVHVCRRNSLHSSHSLSPCAHKPIFYICISMPSLQIGSPITFPQIPYVHALIYRIYFSDLLYYVQQALGSFTSLELTDILSLQRLGNIPLYICTAVMLPFSLITLISLCQV